MRQSLVEDEKGSGDAGEREDGWQRRLVNKKSSACAGVGFAGANNGQPPRTTDRRTGSRVWAIGIRPRYVNGSSTRHVRAR